MAENTTTNTNTDEMVPVTHPSQIKQYMEDTGKKLKSLGLFIWNSEEREFLARDGLSWAKVLGCYFVFYSILASFFVGLLAIFVVTLSMDEPTYYGERSVMSTRNQLNPGLGFRPQVDVEDSLITYSMQSPDEINKLVRNMDLYLDKFYDSRNDTTLQIADCASRELGQLREEFRVRRTSCAFEYRNFLAGTDCDPANAFGYGSNGPCVMIKLNRIFGWIPDPYVNEADVGFDQSVYNVSGSVLEKNIVVICEGEYGTDRDILSSANITYYSMNSRELNVYHVGLMPIYYYPYRNQPEYKSPLVFVKFELPPFLLVNVVCRAYANNIDSSDKLNLRGMTIFQLYVTQ